MHKKTLVCLLALFAASYSFGDEYLSTDTKNPSLIHNSYGDDVLYPCSAGGEPLVIYATDTHNSVLISSKNIINPLYVKEGYTATPLSIETYEQSDLSSFKNLIVKTTNPEAGEISFELRRNDTQPFYVNTVNYPSIDVSVNGDGTQDKYVSAYRIFANDDLDTAIRETFKPIKHYWFDEDTAIVVDTNVTALHAEAATWNQNGEWTDGTLGRHYYAIRYRFSPEQVPNTDPKEYNGYGFWICGGSQEVNPPIKKSIPLSYADTVSH